MVMNYEDISDFEINQAVTCELFGCHEWSVNQEGAFYHCGADGSGYFIQTVADYCNNQSYSWPIIIDSKIAVLPWNSNGWQSYSCHRRDVSMKPIEVLQARRKLGLSQAAFAELMLVSARTIKYWESGERKPSKLAVQRMKDLTGGSWGD